MLSIRLLLEWALGSFNDDNVGGVGTDDLVEDPRRDMTLSEGRLYEDTK